MAHGRPALATDAFNEDVGFARLHYVMGVTDETGARLKSGAAHETATASLARPRSPTPAMADVTKHYHPVREYPYDPTTALERHLVPPSELERLQDDPVFARFKSKAILEESLNLEAFAATLHAARASLRARLQAHVLPPPGSPRPSPEPRDELLVRGGAQSFRNDLLRMRTLWTTPRRSTASPGRRPSSKSGGAKRSFRPRNNDAAAAMESHEHHILELTDKLTAEIDALKERCAKAEAKSGTQAALHKELKETGARRRSWRRNWRWRESRVGAEDAQDAVLAERQDHLRASAQSGGADGDVGRHRADGRDGG